MAPTTPAKFGFLTHLTMLPDPGIVALQSNRITLIQRGGGTGPTKPRQPGRACVSNEAHQCTRVPNPADKFWKMRAGFGPHLLV